jgi:hypothetical protein
MNLSIDKKLNISPAVVLKRAWDLLGIIIVILQLSSHFVVTDSITSTDKQMSFLGFFKMSVANKGGSDDSMIGFLNIHIIVDAYFLIDVIVRLSTSRYLPQSQTGKAQYLRSCWFVVDLLLIFPHGFCWQLWQSRPALQLLSIRQGKRPIFEFFRSREFRKKVFQLIREHREEKKLFRSIKGLLLGSGSVIVAGSNSALSLPASRLKWIFLFGTKALRKTFNFINRVTSSMRKYRNLKVYSCVVRWISWVAMSIRAVYISRMSSLIEAESDDATDSAIGQSKSVD